jgi:hypothetical protein
VVEHASGWLGADPADQAVAAEVARLVERAASEFRGDATLFDQLCAELAAMHTTSSARRSSPSAVTSTPWPVATASRTRAPRPRRDRVRLARGTPTPLVRALLEQDWTRVLALALSREGPGGPTGGLVPGGRRSPDRRVRAVDRAKGGRIDLTEEQFLRQTLSIGLARVGYHGGDLQLVLERLFSDDPRAHQEAELPVRQRAAASEAEADHAALPPPIGQRARTGAARDGAGAAARRMARSRARVGRCERAPQARLGEHLGAPCPLLNWRGAKVAELTAIALARAISSGHARVLAREDGTLLDQAVRRCRCCCASATRARNSPRAAAAPSRALMRVRRPR